MGKGDGFWFQSYWWECPNKLNLNFIHLYLTKKIFKKTQYDHYKLLFQNLVTSMDALYAFIGEENSVNRQNHTGNILKRIPGVFWCNYYNPIFTEFLNKENKLYNFPWYHIEEINTGGTFTILTEQPIDKQIEQKEKEAQEYFGKEKFNGKAQDYPIIS